MRIIKIIGKIVQTLTVIIPVIRGIIAIWKDGKKY